MENTATTVFEIQGLKVNSNLEFNQELFDKAYNKGMSASDNDFGYQFAHKCSEFAASLVAEKSCTLKEASALLGDALFSLNDNHLAYGFELYKVKLEKIGDTDFTDDGKLTTSAKEDIVLGITRLDPEKNKTSMRHTLINILAPLPDLKKTLELRTSPNDSTNKDLKKTLELRTPQDKHLNARIETKEDGSVYIYNDKNQLHAQGIPAVILADGTQKWFLEGIETTQELNKKQVLNNLNKLREPHASNNSLISPKGRI